MRQLLPTLVLIALLTGCSNYQFRSSYRSANALLHDMKKSDGQPFLKAHHVSGNVYVLTQEWQIDTMAGLVRGYGTLYDFNRNMLRRGAQEFAIDSILIFETNRKLVNPESQRITAMAILTGVNLALGVICWTNPKACFGSCPTFYMDGHQNIHQADAEGFSNAISPSLEYTDIDALNNPRVEGRFALTMKNEALETHVVRKASLLAIARMPGQHILHARNDKFYRAKSLVPPLLASEGEINITQKLAKPDGEEWFSLADEHNLSSKQELIAEFEAQPGMANAGLYIHFRQTLMTTYLIYNALQYMGDEISDVFAKIESEPGLRSQLNSGIHGELGEIEVWLWNKATEKWELQGSVYETGPVAINKQVVPFGSDVSGKVRVKLRLNHGLWRIDHLSLAYGLEEVQPIVVEPAEILYKGVPDQTALQKLKSSDQVLLSMPGDEFRLIYELPDNSDYALFLSSRGYYIQWMRDNWLGMKNMARLRTMITRPGQYLREEAKAYKTYEAAMEDAFWGSRIDTKTVHYYEN
ncbi:MAG: hypothetical protein IPM52_07065 [Bacteroidetes bacterium]|nr:hypothetical protein [Bacteroidota bacterium]